MAQLLTTSFSDIDLPEAPKGFGFGGWMANIRALLILVGCTIAISIATYI